MHPCQAITHPAVPSGRPVLPFNLVLTTVRALLLVGISSAAPSFAQATERISVASGGAQSNGAASGASVSQHGEFVVFSSDAPDLVASDFNGVRDVFVRDRVANQTTRVSVGPGGVEALGASQTAFSSFSTNGKSISADGRYVVYSSVASNLVGGDTNSQRDIFLYDRTLQVTTRVNVSTAGVQSNGASEAEAISADGSTVAFQSSANNLVVGDTNGVGDIFVRNLATGITSLESQSSAFVLANQGSYTPVLSADGRYLAFMSFATNLVPSDTNNREDVFVRDTWAAQTTRASVDSAGNQGNDWSSRPSISADGRWVAFTSFASNMVVADTNNTYDVFLRDRVAATTTRVSQSELGVQATDSSHTPSISADGRYVAFRMDANNIIPGVTAPGIAARDMSMGNLVLASVSSTGVAGNLSSQAASISADGLFVVFESTANNLVIGDTNNVADIFLREGPLCQTVTQPPGTVTAVPADPCPGEPVDLTASGGQGGQLYWYLDSLNNSPIASGLTVTVPAPATSGAHTYYARWESTNCVPSLPLTAPIVVGVTPANNECSTATAAGVGVTAFDSTCATDSNNVGCTANRDVWHVFAPTTCGTLQADVSVQGAFPTVVGIYRGVDCGSLTLVSCGTTSASAPVQLGVDLYWIRVGSSDGSGGPGTLTLSETNLVPSNNDCSTPSTIVDAVPNTFSTICASTDGQAHVGCSATTQQIDNDIWFRYAAPVNGLLRVSTCGTANFDTLLGVYRDDPCPVTGSSLLACADDTPGCGLTTTLLVGVAQGQSYLIRVGGQQGAVGTGTLLATTTPAPNCPPAFAAAGVNSYQVTGAATGAAWSWRLHATDGSFADLFNFNVPGVTPGLTSLDVALAFAASINQAVAANGCTPGQMNAVASTVFGQTLLSISFRRASIATVLELYVGPGGGPPTCLVGTQLPACTFNPVIELALLPGQDCNLNGSDDFLDIISGTSLDLDGNGVPDECSVAPGVVYCVGDGSSKNCPCGNNSTYGDQAGCRNSKGQGARLTGSGVASVLSDSLVLHGAGMPNSPCLYFQGSAQSTLTFGDGFLCAGGIIRLGVKINVQGNSAFPPVGGPSISSKGGITVAGTTRYYQIWYRDQTSFCTPANYNLSNGLAITWGP